MNAAPGNLVSSSSRPLQLRMRQDLVVDRQRYQGREYHIVKDPLNLKYYRFEAEEFAILQMLDGKFSADQIKRKFERTFRPQRISLHEIQSFIGQLYQSSLLISDAAGQGEQLLKRCQENRRKQRRAAMTNIMTIRFRGFDPDRLLTLMDDYFGWIFSWPAFVCSILLSIAALVLVTVHFDVFSAKLPNFQEFFAARNWIFLAITLIGTKVLHEFGHGLACKRFGSDCHEMGVMMLILMPCLYCNVSDSWMLPNKWKRAAIGAAGMYVELVLAAICTFLWWFSHPGVVHYACLNIMFVSSVSTILFNANPLLRYDGYYILSDILEIPNLRQKASTLLRRTFGGLLLGLEAPHDPFLPSRHRWLFVVFAISAALYRWVITFAIFWFLYRLLEPYGFKIVGQLLALMALYGLFGQPLVQMFKFFYVPGRLEKVKKLRVAFTSILCLAALCGVMLIPLPHYVTCCMYVESEDGVPVYVEIPGTVKRIHVDSDAFVESGDSIMTLENSQRDLQIQELRGELQVTQTKLNQLYRRESIDPSAENEIPEIDEMIRNLRYELAQRVQELQKLVVTAPAAGYVVPTAYMAKPKDQSRLPNWFGHPLEKRNEGSFMTSGTPVCQIVRDPKKFSAVLLVDEESIEFVRTGQTAELFLKQSPLAPIEAQITQISTVELERVPSHVSSKSGGDVITRIDDQGHEVPDKSLFQVNVPFTDQTGRVIIGATGDAKIYAGSRTIGQRCWRFFCSTFNFEL
jgi:putative peptide zinc metalloprotease protein